jgi:uncharacterized membrane protein
MVTSARWFLGATMAGLGILGLIHGDFALVWQRIPVEHLPGRTAVAYFCAALELSTGLGLFAPRTAKLAAPVLAPYLALWVLLLKVPALLAAPGMAAVWLGFGEIAVLAAGGWVVFVDARSASGGAFLSGDGAVRAARLVFALALPMIGLSHFVYAQQTAAFVPAWLPDRVGWAYLTGAGFFAAGLGVLCSLWSRLAATMLAGMLGVITLLVWGLGIVVAPGDRVQWTGFFISSAITSGAWAVATSFRDAPWRGIGWSAQRPPRS